MLAGLMLSDRAATALNVLVDEYLQSATPVALEELARSCGQKINSATVPNTIARPTEGDYISRPNVPYGSACYDLVHRCYVEFPPKTPSLPTELKETVDRDLAQIEPDIGDWSKRCAVILYDLTENLVIVFAPRFQLRRLKRIQLVFLQESVAFLVLVLGEARLLRKTFLFFFDSVNQDKLDQAASRLNRSFRGLNGSQTKSNHLNRNPLVDKIKAGSMSLTRATKTKNTTPMAYARNGIQGNSAY